MRIRNLFVLAFCLIALPGLLGTIWSAGMSWTAMRETRRATVAMAAINDAQRAQFALALDFGSMGPSVMAAEVDIPTLEALSRQAESLVSTSLASARDAGLDTAALNALAADAASLRTRLYEAYKLPVAARDKGLVTAALALRSSVTTVFSGVTEAATGRIAHDAPAIIGLINVADTVSILRDVVGRRNGMLIGWISGSPMTEEALSQADGLTGRAALAWDTLQRTVQTVPDNENLKRNLAAERDSYLNGSELRWQKAMAFAHRAFAAKTKPEWPETVAQMRQWATPAQGAILQLRDTALNEGIARADAAWRYAIFGCAVTLILTLGCLFFAGFSVLLVSKLLLWPMQRLIASIASIAAGDLVVSVPSRNRRDELGELAGAIETLRQTLQDQEAQGAAQSAAQTAELNRGRRVTELLARFETDSFEALEIVASAATQLDSTAAGMLRTAEIGTGRAIAVAEASGQASSNVNTVAAATEELSASINQVAQQVGSSADRARQAVQAVRGAEGAVSGLSETATRIGAVVQLISGVAGRTNLLALNATIEAARAGESGRGFAVVANEVKSLAGQTAKATEEISQQIARMQSETREMVAVIGGIAGMIDALDETSKIVSTVAAEQAQATQEIGIAVAEAARGADRASHEAAGVREDAEQTGMAATEVQAASAELARRTEMLHHQMKGFLRDLRAA